MGKKRHVNDKVQVFLAGHPVAKGIYENTVAILMSTLSAFCFAFGYVCFLAPSAPVDGATLDPIVSGGMSGVSQTLTLALELLFPMVEINHAVAYSILYFVLNIPILILSWVGISKRFTIFTLINVASVSILTSLLGSLPIEWLSSFVDFINQNGGMLARALFAGVLTGLSTAIAFKFDLSPGGIDVIAYYIALKKSTLTGKYAMMLNGTVALAFFLLTATKAGWAYNEVIVAFASLFFTVLYIMVSQIVVDTINIRNKKTKIEIVTAREDLASYLIEVFPHAATIVRAQGAYSHADKYIITMVVSSYELKDAISVIQTEDPSSFIQVTELVQVYGRFFITPVK